MRVVPAEALETALEELQDEEAELTTRLERVKAGQKFVRGLLELAEVVATVDDHGWIGELPVVESGRLPGTWTAAGTVPEVSDPATNGADPEPEDQVEDQEVADALAGYEAVKGQSARLAPGVHTVALRAAGSADDVGPWLYRKLAAHRRATGEELTEISLELVERWASPADTALAEPEEVEPTAEPDMVSDPIPPDPDERWEHCGKPDDGWQGWVSNPGDSIVLPVGEKPGPTIYDHDDEPPAAPAPKKLSATELQALGLTEKMQTALRSCAAGNGRSLHHKTTRGLYVRGLVDDVYDLTEKGRATLRALGPG